MLTTTKTRKAAINQNPEAIALLKVDGGYQVFESHQEIKIWENNTGRALPKTAYVDYKRQVNTTPEKEEKMGTIETVKAEIAALENGFEEAYAKAEKRCKIDRVVNEGCDGYSLGEDMKAKAFSEMMEKIKPLKEEMFAMEWTKDVTISRRAAWNTAAKAADAGGKLKGKSYIRAVEYIATQVEWCKGIQAPQDKLNKAIKMHNI